MNVTRRDKLIAVGIIAAGLVAVAVLVVLFVTYPSLGPIGLAVLACGVLVLWLGVSVYLVYNGLTRFLVSRRARRK